MAGINLDLAERNIWRIVQSVVQLAQGRMNCTGVVTLTPGQTSTVVNMVNFGRDAIPLLQPMTASAAASLPNVYISARGQGTFTITHDNSAATDRTFGIVAIG